MNFERRYRMIRDGEISERESLPPDHPGRGKDYVEMMQTMLQLGVTALNLDMKNLKAYPTTMRLWFQMQDYPDEIIDLFDNTIKDCMIELAEKRMQEMRREKMQNGSSRQQPNSSSMPPATSSDADQNGHSGPAGGQGAGEIPDLVREVESKVYRVRPFDLDTTTNLRDLNPKGMSYALQSIFSH